MNDKRIGIVIGDAAGIGPEVVAKIFSKKRNNHEKFLLIGDLSIHERNLKKLKLQIELSVINNEREIKNKKEQILFLDLATFANKDLVIGKASKSCGEAIIKELNCALDLAKKKFLAGLFYAPLNKHSLKLAGSKHYSEKELFAESFNSSEANYEINILNNIWANRVTSHISFRDIVKGISKVSIFNAINVLNKILKETNSSPFKIYVAGLNPHAGEGGILGDEESEIIYPAIENAQAEGICAVGPFPADTIFLTAKKEPICGVVTMYHDQGQIAMKMMGFDSGITFQSGFPIPIATAAHGTAFDIAGKGIANEKSAENALKHICKIVYGGNS